MKTLLISMTVCLVALGCKKEDGERVAVNNQSNEFSIKVNKEQLAKDARAAKEEIKDAGAKISDELGKLKDQTAESLKKGSEEIKEKTGAARN